MIDSTNIGPKLFISSIMSLRRQLHNHMKPAWWAEFGTLRAIFQERSTIYRQLVQATRFSGHDFGQLAAYRIRSRENPGGIEADPKQQPLTDACVECRSRQ